MNEANDNCIKALKNLIANMEAGNIDNLKLDGECLNKDVVMIELVFSGSPDLEL